MNSPKTLTVTECHQLLDALLPKNVSGSKFYKGLRNHTVALLMLDAGLRVGEAVGLDMSDLYYGDAPVTNLVVRGELAKNKKERTIPLSGRIREALKTLWTKCPTVAAALPLAKVFTAGHKNNPLTTRQVERIIRRAAVKSIGRPIHPHVLRHTFASRLMRKTNARIVMELLGHSQMSSTQIYMNPNGDDLKKAITEICDDPQEKHLLMTDSSLDSHAANGA